MTTELVSKFGNLVEVTFVQNLKDFTYLVCQKEMGLNPCPISLKYMQTSRQLFVHEFVNVCCNCEKFKLVRDLIKQTHFAASLLWVSARRLVKIKVTKSGTNGCCSEEVKIMQSFTAFAQTPLEKVLASQEIPVISLCCKPPSKPLCLVIPDLIQILTVMQSELDSTPTK